jgi:lipoprotein-anchoring transpeptidase ErfK/SrfK
VNNHGPLPAIVGGDASADSASTGVVPARFLIVRVTRPEVLTSAPGAGRVVGQIDSQTRFLANPMVAWVRSVSPDGRYGRVSVPWSGTDRSGWMSLAGLPRDSTSVMIRASLSARRLIMYRDGQEVMNVPIGIGGPQSPSPLGHFWVTDPTPTPAGSEYGSFAFGISATQPNTPPGWTGANQMAIHGTNEPWTIGAAASAGCLHVSEQTLARLRAVVKPGTPVDIVA